MVHSCLVGHISKSSQQRFSLQSICDNTPKALDSNECSSTPNFIFNDDSPGKFGCNNAPMRLYRGGAWRAMLGYLTLKKPIGVVLIETGAKTRITFPWFWLNLQVNKKLQTVVTVEYTYLAFSALVFKVAPTDLEDSNLHSIAATFVLLGKE